MSDNGFLAATRDSYDEMLDGYLGLVDGHLEQNPIERALLTAFAEMARGKGRVADIGCGPGYVTAFLNDQGLDAFGIDLSPRMIEHARATYPGLSFETGNMLELALEDASLGGLLSYYSFIHLPWDRRPEAFEEFHRVLAPGGQLMLAFQVGSDKRHRTEAFGRPVDCTWHRQQPAEIASLLRTAGFEPTSTTVREPENEESLPQGFVLAVKQ